jgi:hypothetical protein
MPRDVGAWRGRGIIEVRGVDGVVGEADEGGGAMPMDAERPVDIFEVTIDHDDQPEAVAEKFLEVFRLMGIAVRDVSEDGDVSLTYLIGGMATPEDER